MRSHAVTCFIPTWPQVAVITNDPDPQDYFGVCTEAAIKDNVVVVYELLEEMLDNGFPLATESNILKELIKPPTILRTVVNTITGNRQDHLLTTELLISRFQEVLISLL